MKQLLPGNAAVARGLYEAGCRFLSAYPGTPSTEIAEYASEYDEIYTEWAPNEKVALEAASGASVAGARAVCCMKHVGLNVAADPLFTASYTGVNGGFVVIVADDQGMHSSQNEQDSRWYAKAAKLPLIEPSDSSECLEFTKLAFDISEKYDTPVILRTCTRAAHTQSPVETSKRIAPELRPYVKDPKKYVMIPSNALLRHAFVEDRTASLSELAETTPINRIEPGDTETGFITAGVCYQYVREVFPNASVLKLGLINPLPTALIAKFASSVKRLIVVEELDSIIETHCKAAGIRVDGGKDLFGFLGELSQGRIAEAMGKSPKPARYFGADLPSRPPVMCPGCPHRGLFYVLGKMKLTVFGDIGCYTLGALPPLSAMDTTICMGASVSGAHGFNTIRGADAKNRCVAVIGDSTFIHSGITGLIDVVYNKGISTVIISDNSTTGMTGHQDNPTTGKTIKGEAAPLISLEKLCEAAGVKNIRVADPRDTDGLSEILSEEMQKSEASVIIARSPCVLLKGIKKAPPLSVSEETCTGCGMCMKIGCPAISLTNAKAFVDTTLCAGCSLCVRMCKANAFREGGQDNVR
ncbi:MAG: indolepyruvate ferredoxin oxidoreductase subunit alpha [Oscillospiraceae bacterium]|nr:indolepyruvate ferredoxin oxidoreductase subunit alpha [Oscillospiraceae bacterium]